MDHSRNTAINTHTHVYIYIYIHTIKKNSQVQQTEIHKIQYNIVKLTCPSNLHHFTAKFHIGLQRTRPPLGSQDPLDAAGQLTDPPSRRLGQGIGGQVMNGWNAVAQIEDVISWAPNCSEKKNISNKYPKLYVQWLEWKSIFLWRFQI